jgi:hypothetical protein
MRSAWENSLQDLILKITEKSGLEMCSQCFASVKPSVQTTK